MKQFRYRTTKLVPWPTFSQNREDTDMNYFSLAAINFHEKLIQHLFKEFTKVHEILLSAKVNLTEFH